MLLDEYLPEFDFEETHGITVNADASAVYAAINEVDFSESTIVRWLLRIRGMSGTNVRLDRLSEFNFARLAERVDKELLIGLAERFWTPFGDLQHVTADSFRSFNKPGYAKAVWNFSLEPSDSRTRLTTETRIRCLDANSRRSFGLYWTIVQPFSGWIRMEMLRMIKGRAETLS